MSNEMIMTRDNNNNTTTKQMAVAVVVVVVVVFLMLSLTFPVTAVRRLPACFEINEWVFDEGSQRCLVRLRRTQVSSSSGVIVSGKSVAEMESRAQCSFSGFSRSIDDDCWKQQQRGATTSGGGGFFRSSSTSTWSSLSSSSAAGRRQLVVPP